MIRELFGRRPFVVLPKNLVVGLIWDLKGEG